MKSPRKTKEAKAPKAAKAIASHNLIDPALKKTFLEMRDSWSAMNDRANSAAAKRRQYQKEIKESGYSMQQIKISLLLQTPEGEAEFKAEMANRLLAAAYSDADIGEQLSLFLDEPRVPAVDRAYKEGQSDCMANKAAQPKYDPSTEQHAAYMSGFHAEQERMVKTGIGKLESKEPKADKPKGKRGRPPGSGKKANGEATEAPERVLIPKAEKDAKAAARAPAVDSGPPRKPAAEPVTRATLAAQKAAAKETADSYFTRTEPKGNA